MNASRKLDEVGAPERNSKSARLSFRRQVMSLASAVYIDIRIGTRNAFRCFVEMSASGTDAR